MLNNAEFLKLFLPELLIEHFEMIKFKEENKILNLYFEEKNTVPKEFSSLVLQSKGFVPLLQLMIFLFAENREAPHQTPKMDRY